ncbi:MAG TPA: Gfo/Idh/MocA family oxidoreductase [Acidimicrobiales bacterium]|nr:Gfo/Idh/MocA family oxidoreductase [Acidimicrobiales bacterium]
MSASESSPPRSPGSPLRVGVVGLGRVFDLTARAYIDSPDAEVVALVDPDAERRARRLGDWPGAKAFESVAELAASGLDLDAVDVLVPIVHHEAVATECLGHGWHVNLQKPIANDLASAGRILDAARANGRSLRVMENYLFYEPLRALKAVVDSGELGAISSYHLKMVASGRGGWDVPGDAYEHVFDQARRGRGPLLFDDGWHKLSTALWLFGPIREVRAWVGSTEVLPGVEIDAPTSVAWEHEGGVRGVWDITLAVDMYLRSDYYTNDERWEVTGRRGYARVNRCTSRGIQEPSLEVYVDGVSRSYHALDDDWASSFRDSGRHWVQWLRDPTGPMWWSGEESLDVLRFALAAYQSHSRGGVGVDPRALS